MQDRPPGWFKDLIAAGCRIGIPVGTLLSRRHAAAGGQPGRLPFTLRLRTGEDVRLEADGENYDYVRGWLAGSCGTATFIWFETCDGSLVGLNLAHVGAASFDAAAPGTGCHASRKDSAVLRFSDGAPLELPKLAGRAIDQLQCATLHPRRSGPVHVLNCGGERTVPIDLASLIYVTMPAAWLDDES